MIEANFADELRMLQGKTIAVVYIFEGETAKGFEHYHVWKGDVISGWLNAIQALSCRPLLLDVRTFVEKAVNQSLPPIDFVLNLNCGSCELSSMGLVPSTCSFLSIPCIPCNTCSIITGEDKYIANLIAMARGLQTPQELPPEDRHGIYRPLNFGSSVGVRKGMCPAPYRDGTYQEFIPGYDITTPIVYNPMTEQMELLPTIMIIPETGQTDWFYSEEANKSFQGYRRAILPRFKSELEALYRDVVRAFSISTFCRIDARLKCQDPNELDALLHSAVGPKDVYFLEINPMPSIRPTNNDFKYAFERLALDSDLAVCIKAAEQVFGSLTLNGFLLACSMLSSTRAMCRRQRDCTRA